MTERIHQGSPNRSHKVGSISAAPFGPVSEHRLISPGTAGNRAYHKAYEILGLLALSVRNAMRLVTFFLAVL